MTDDYWGPMPDDSEYPTPRERLDDGEVERLRALVRDLNAALVAKQQEGDRLAGNYVAIRAENQSLRDHHYSLDACPECGRLPPDHALDCALDAALRGADE